MVQELIKVRKMSVAYSSIGSAPLRAVDHVSFALNSSEVIGVLGESGSGKTTLALSLLRLLAAGARYEGGEVIFRGRDLLALSESELRQVRGREISLISQDPALSLNPVMRAGDQIAEVLRAHTGMSPKERKSRVEKLLRSVGFDQPQQIGLAYPHQLSGGQRQRIAVAQAIACHPALVIADEPTSKLDSGLQMEILTLLAEIRRREGTTFLIISHDPTIFAGFADRIIVMYAGRIVEEGRTGDIFRAPMHPYTRALLELSQRYLVHKVASRVRLPVITGEPPSLSRHHTGCRFEPRCPERMSVCTASDPQEFMPEPFRRVSCFKYGN
ncbi:MAG: ABC transporter ATP-binding protein [Acidobacteriota bacterium]|nr:ABC transporter ATP-binding protein [Acidobacteriota bacterium]